MTATRFTPRAIMKLSAMVLASLLLMPPQWLLMRFTRGRVAFVLPRWWFACLRHALRIRVDVVGTPRTAGGTLFAGNHVSHFDIIVLGSLLHARFIAKDEMKRWPGMRPVGELAQTLYVSRRSRDAAAASAAVFAQLRPGQDVVLFPEGTTSSGECVLPFKSSLLAPFLASAADPPWTLQPFTMAIVSVDGRPVDHGGDRDLYAFHGDMDPGAHVRRFLAVSGATVRVTFHAPVALARGSDRKALAASLHATVASALPPALRDT